MYVGLGGEQSCRRQRWPRSALKTLLYLLVLLPLPQSFLNSVRGEPGLGADHFTVHYFIVCIYLLPKRPAHFSTVNYLYTKAQKRSWIFSQFLGGSYLQHFNWLPGLSSWTSYLALGSFFPLHLGLEFGGRGKLSQGCKFPKDQTLGQFSNLKAPLSGQD